jgi:ABC-type multidrug transport system fused ATPase/permease subunit
MSLKVDFENLFQALKNRDLDAANLISDLFVYSFIASIFPGFMAVFTLLGVWRGMKFIHALILAFCVFCISVGSVLFARAKALKQSRDLYSPSDDIPLTVREDYSSIASMILQGRFDEAESEALSLFNEKFDPLLCKVTGDEYFRLQKYEFSAIWFIRGIEKSSGVLKLYFLTRVIELYETKLSNPVKARLYIEKLVREYNGTEEAEHYKVILRGNKN